MSKQDFIRYPSFAVGWDETGKPHVIACGDAQEALDAFKAERDKTKYKHVAYCRKVRPDKRRDAGLKQKTTVSVDLSEFDGKKIDPDRVQELVKKQEAERAAAAVIVGEPKESSAPKKRGRTK